MHASCQANTKVLKIFALSKPVRTNGHRAQRKHSLRLVETDSRTRVDPAHGVPNRLCARICKSAHLAWVSETGGRAVWRMGFQPWAVSRATGLEAMGTDPRPSWAVPLSWEVTAKALGGRREALIR